MANNQSSNNQPTTPYVTAEDIDMWVWEAELDDNTTVEHTTGLIRTITVFE